MITKTILIAEDDRLSRDLLKEAFLAFAGHCAVRVAGDGSEALDVLGAERIDVLLTDLIMPVMDGFELIAMVRARDRCIPIYVMTSCCIDLAQERLKGQDISGYFPKPYDVFEMISLITGSPLPKDCFDHYGGKTEGATTP